MSTKLYRVKGREFTSKAEAMAFARESGEARIEEETTVSGTTETLTGETVTLPYPIKATGFIRVEGA